MRTTWLRIDSSSCFHSSSNVKHSSEETIWLNKHLISDNQHVQDGINKRKNKTTKVHIRITLSAEFSSEENSFHSKNVSDANEFPSGGNSTSITLSIRKARGLNLYCWASKSLFDLAYAFILNQSLANSSNILCKSWSRKHRMS